MTMVATSFRVSSRPPPLIAAIATGAQAQSARRMLPSGFVAERTIGEESVVLFKPYYLATAPDGRIVVFDAGDMQIRAFSTAGEELWHVGRKGHGSNEFSDAEDRHVDPDGDVLVLVRIHGSRDEDGRSADPGPQASVVTRVDPCAAEYAHAAARQADHLHVLASGTGNRRNRIVDVYDVSSGGYLGSHELPRAAAAIAVLPDGRFVTLERDTVPTFESGDGPGGDNAITVARRSLTSSQRDTTAVLNP